ncbi:subclass B3 metallo-beta-lactamase [Granulicella sp. dw_53]|uniref:subclass B3 metallo-beta-lactamase n=1 Tax=Granulicella sp. dw_53 TaxID=2719792 RepID=UPI001BD27094|nr:subclass B3 metallo-beta-lactamase [Granulicella sp. dw_53]
MTKKLRLNLSLFFCAELCIGFLAASVHAQQKPADHPAVSVEGERYTPLSIVTRNMGTEVDQTGQFPPHKVIGNIYYVGTRTLSSYLIVTPEGNILLDSTYERNVPVILKSVEQLGFKFSDTKILLGNHAHGDHQEGDALVKMVTGAQVVAMEEDLPALRAMKPGGKEHPVDRVIHDGDTVVLGGVTLVAHLTAGHTRGCTTYTTVVKEKGKSYNVVFGCSLRAPGVITPAIAAEFKHSFEVVHALPCDVQLGDHPAQYGMEEKYAKLKAGGPNPFIDKATCKREIAVEEAMFHAIVEEQGKGQ